MESRCRLHRIAEGARRTAWIGADFVRSTRSGSSDQSQNTDSSLLLGYSAVGRLLGMPGTPENVSFEFRHRINRHSLTLSDIRSYHHTVSATLLYGLREALAVVCAEGLDAIIRRHQSAAAYLREKLTEHALQLYVELPAARLPTITSVKLPVDCDWKRVIDFAANE